jgi:hypothetical protein
MIVDLFGRMFEHKQQAANRNDTMDDSLNDSPRESSTESGKVIGFFATVFRVERES